VAGCQGHAPIALWIMLLIDVSVVTHSSCVLRAWVPSPQASKREAAELRSDASAAAQRADVAAAAESRAAAAEAELGEARAHAHSAEAELQGMEEAISTLQAKVPHGCAEP
jgi:hypothetical protein